MFFVNRAFYWGNWILEIGFVYIFLGGEELDK
jgi:hypothetical protein